MSSGYRVWDRRHGFDLPPIVGGKLMLPRSLQHMLLIPVKRPQGWVDANGVVRCYVTLCPISFFDPHLAAFIALSYAFVLV